MSGTNVVLFAEPDGSCPVRQWLDGLPERARLKVLERVTRLKEFGYELKRPFAAPLRAGVCELRARCGKVQYRVLYVFCGHRAVLTNGFVKKGAKVPVGEIDVAASRRSSFEHDPDAHIYVL